MTLKNIFWDEELINPKFQLRRYRRCLVFRTRIEIPAVGIFLVRILPADLENPHRSIA